MRLEYQILCAAALDLVAGDPRWLPHPVRGIGRLAQGLEGPMRRLVGHPKAAGIATVLLVVAISGAAAWGIVKLAGAFHPLAADVAGILLIYTTVAARDMARHSMAVFRALAAGDLGEARRRVGMIVGRDVDGLDEAGVARAAVESVAESTVDGVTAPLFFAIIAGPVGAVVYRAINTLDSTFGYRNGRYADFGWASARLDDAANFLPARLTAPAACAAAAVIGMRARGAFSTVLRDARKHESPNAGFAEAATAGALGVQLGGVSYYGGEPVEKPTIGQPVAPVSRRHIVAANALMFATAAVFLSLGLAARALAVHAWVLWRAAA